jgi:anthranilate synthase component 2
MIVLIDNYDSFTYNLVQYLGDLRMEMQIFRNDQISVRQAIDLKPAGFVISPGPSDPDNAGICLELIGAASEQNIPLLGVCLGHQAIGQAFGGKVVRTHPMHGKTSQITHTDTDIFRGIPAPVEVARYHSLIVERASLPDCLSVTAQTEDGIIMGLAHKTKPVYGVQFHPESIATDHGHTMLKNFVELL